MNIWNLVFVKTRGEDVMAPIVNQTPKCREHFMCVVLLDVFATLDTGMSVK